MEDKQTNLETTSPIKIDKVINRKENMTKPSVQKTNIDQSIKQNVQIDELKEDDELLREGAKRIELNSSIVPELEEMARHGEYLSKIIRDKLTALDKARELAVDRRQSSTAASRTPPISEQQAL